MTDRSEPAALLHDLASGIDPDDLMVPWADLPEDHQEHWRSIAAELCRLIVQQIG
jgi:hypothetical protein